MDPAIILGFLGTLFTAVIAAGGTWLVAARKMSGTVRSSEAVDLWKEAADQRKWAAERLAHLEDENLELTKQIHAQIAEIQRCHERMKGMEDQLKKLLGDELPDYLS